MDQGNNLPPIGRRYTQIRKKGIIGAHPRLSAAVSSVILLRPTVPRLRTFRLSASFWEAARIALDSLRKNKLRSFLTLLGIILATTTLIAVTALIHGMNLYIADKVSNMGSDGFRIVRMAWFGALGSRRSSSRCRSAIPQIRPDEYEFVKSQATLLKDLGMMVSRQARVSYKGDSHGRRGHRGHHRQHPGHQ